MIEAVLSKPQGAAVRQTTVRMTKDMARVFTSAYRVIYGQRGCSRWVEEALESLLKDASFVMKVGVGEADQAFEANKGVSLTPKCQRLLEDGIRRYRRLDPMAEGVGSKILRAAIKQRLDQDEVPEPSPTAQLEVKLGRLGKKAVSR